MVRYLGALAAMVAMSACNAAGGAGEPNGGPTPRATEPLAADGHRHDLDVDWMAFSELDLHRSAVAIVRGRVVGQRLGTHRTYPVDPETGRQLTPAEAGDRYAELPLTTSIVQIDEKLFARQGMVAQPTIQVVQLGGRYADGCWVEPNDQPILRVDDEVVVFLKPAGMIPREAVDHAEHYSIIGGQQGLIPLHDGVAVPIPTTAFARYARRPIAELTSELTDACGANCTEGGL